MDECSAFTRSTKICSDDIQKQTTMNIYSTIAALVDKIQGLYWRCIKDISAKSMSAFIEYP